MEKRKVTKFEYVYSEVEQKSLETICEQLYRLTQCDAFSTSKMSNLVNQLKVLLEGETNE
jgi:hypothetical protein